MAKVLSENELLFGELMGVLDEQKIQFDPILLKRIFDYTQ